jgi:hypothetical protein
MERRMESIEVYTNETGNITIKQEVGVEDGVYITITADQVGVLVKWLREARAELRRARQTEESPREPA